MASAHRLDRGQPDGVGVRLKVTYLDGTEAEVVVTASARRSFEQTHNLPLIQAVGSYQSWWADELAHASLVQTTDEDRDFEPWLDTVQEIQWEMPANKVAQIGQLLGVEITEAEVADAVPTGGAKGRSRASSSKPRSTRGKASTT